jgi:hypothetical protein
MLPILTACSLRLLNITGCKRITQLPSLAALQVSVLTHLRAVYSFLVITIYVGVQARVFASNFLAKGWKELSLGHRCSFAALGGFYSCMILH